MGWGPPPRFAFPWQGELWRSRRCRTGGETYQWRGPDSLSLVARAACPTLLQLRVRRCREDCLLRGLAAPHTPSPTPGRSGTPGTGAFVTRIGMDVLPCKSTGRAQGPREERTRAAGWREAFGGGRGATHSLKIPYHTTHDAK